MNLQNGYKVIYEKTADGKRIFYATKNSKCDPTVDTKIAEATIGEYKLVYEKDGKIYCSTTGIPANSDVCIDGLEEVFVEAKEPVVTPAEEPAAAYSRRSKKTVAVEKPVEEVTEEVDATAEVEAE